MLFAIVSFLMHPIRFIQDWRDSRARFDKEGYPFTCEVCNGPGVVRSGPWDYCPKGHTYIGKRTEVP